jgi:hypothetical protein
MPLIEIIDTFPHFLSFWSGAGNRSLEALVEAWERDHMVAWPQLLAKQIDDYESQGEDWQAIAGERVFPFLDERLPAMRSAHANLLETCAPLYIRAQEALGFESEAVCVIHVGIGCGAGWVTTYENRPAILFGLENIAECGWSEPPAITGLIAHEIGHLAHFHWRAQHGLRQGSGPWWQIYEEGFAQRCEHIILGADTWHMAQGETSDWIAWCEANRRWLAAEFLRVTGRGEPVRAFFGSWHKIRGRSQTGYYLGHQVIRELESTMTLQEIALMSSDDTRLRRSVERMATSAT